MADSTYNNPTSYGLFVPTTNVWDVESNDVKSLIVSLYQNINLIATVLNLKDSGYYDTNIFVTGQQYFPNPLTPSNNNSGPAFRPVYRKVINFGALTVGAKSVNHGITVNSSTTFTRIYGTASDTTGFNYIPLPYASVTANSNIELSVNATQVTITPGAGTNRTNFDTVYVVLEYLMM
jgi:hypothetical protein